MFTIEKIIKSDRKSISIQVLHNGNLLIRAPRNISKNEIERIINKHKNWIERKQETIKNRTPIAKKFVEGETFLLFGKKLFLKFSKNYAIPAIFDNKILINQEVEKNWRQIFELWYKKTALDFFKKRALIYSKLLGVNYKIIKISNAQKRWGSCSSKGNINLNWRLIMSPIEIIDYVVIHELAHLIEPNHSKNFWYHVQRIQPEYKQHRKWLKENGYMLNF